jgi:hypothetical protein
VASPKLLGLQSRRCANGKAFRSVAEPLVCRSIVQREQTRHFCIGKLSAERAILECSGLPAAAAFSINFPSE